MEDKITISEVGPRDGLQNCDAIMPTPIKKKWIEALYNAGLREIEVGSFVPAKLLPQLADTNLIVDYAKNFTDLCVAVLVPNAKGAQNAIHAGAHKLTLPLSVSETHSLKNLRRNHSQVIEEARAISQMIADLPAGSRPHFEGSLSTLFGCTLEGPIPDKQILHLTEQLLEAGVDEIGLSDTTGYADPRSVRTMIKNVRSVAGAEKVCGIHLHNTRGLGLANALAAFEEGLTTFDASLGGLGGCPFAPGASGNIATEDLAFMFEAMGVHTNIDMEALFAARSFIEQGLPGEPLYGFTPEAGLPLGFSCT